MVLVVTGGIGSGKSLVSRMLEERYGIPVYDADSKVKALYVSIPSMIDEIESVLGVALRDTSGDFQPRKLAEVIFKDPVALCKVEDIVFPQLKADFSGWAKAQEKNVVAFESATILEKPQFDGFGDIVLLVDAPLSVRLSRACLRDGVDEASVLRRMSAQQLMNRLSEGETCPRVTHTIMNDTTASDLSLKLDEFVDKYVLTKML